MKFIRKYRWWLASGVLGALFAVAAIKLSSISFLYGCGNSVHSEAVAPDGKLKAVTFERNCGATTGFSTQISIIRASGTLPNGSGNVLVIAGHPNQVAPQLEWAGPQKLRIYKRLTGEEPKSETTWGWLRRVEIDYGFGSQE